MDRDAEAAPNLATAMPSKSLDVLVERLWLDSPFTFEALHEVSNRLAALRTAADGIADLCDGPPDVWKQLVAYSRARELFWSINKLIAEVEGGMDVAYLKYTKTELH